MNHINITGRLTRDCDVRYTASGKVVASFTVAVQRPFNRDITDFLDVVAWGKTAEVCGNNLSKGRRVLVEGVATINSYTDKNGQKRNRFEINAQNVEFLDYKNNGGNNDSSGANFESFGGTQEEIDF